MTSLDITYITHRLLGKLEYSIYGTLRLVSTSYIVFEEIQNHLQCRRLGILSQGQREAFQSRSQQDNLLGKDRCDRHLCGVSIITVLFSGLVEGNAGSAAPFVSDSLGSILTRLYRRFPRGLDTLYSSSRRSNMCVLLDRRCCLPLSVVRSKSDHGVQRAFSCPDHTAVRNLALSRVLSAPRRTLSGIRSRDISTWIL